MRRILAALAVTALVVTTRMSVAASPTADDHDPTLIAAATGEQMVRAVPGSPLRRWLSLTEEQTRRIQEVLAVHRERTTRRRIALARARLDLRALLREPTPNRGRVDAVARRISDLRQQLVRARLETVLELRQVLTPEQWGRLRLLLARRERLMRRR